MGYQAGIQKLDTVALFDIKGPQAAVWDWCGDALPPPSQNPNSTTDKDGRALYFVGPDHWILRDGLSQEPTLNAALRPEDAPEDISIVLISDTLAFFKITGPQSRDIISIACPIDLRKVDATPDFGSFTAAFNLKALLVRHPDGYEIAVDQSYGDYFQDRLEAVLSSEFT